MASNHDASSKLLISYHITHPYLQPREQYGNGSKLKTYWPTDSGGFQSVWNHEAIGMFAITFGECYEQNHLFPRNWRLTAQEFIKHNHRCQPRLCLCLFRLRWTAEPVREVCFFKPRNEGCISRKKGTKPKYFFPSSNSGYVERCGNLATTTGVWTINRLAWLRLQVHSESVKVIGSENIRRIPKSTRLDGM